MYIQECVCVCVYIYIYLYRYTHTYLCNFSRLVFFFWLKCIQNNLTKNNSAKYFFNSKHQMITKKKCIKMKVNEKNIKKLRPGEFDLTT